MKIYDVRIEYTVGKITSIGLYTDKETAISAIKAEEPYMERRAYVVERELNKFEIDGKVVYRIIK